MLLRPSRCRRILTLAVLLGTLSGTNVDSQSSRPQLSCNVYNELNRSCDCAGQDNYLLSYGRKYCERFLNATGWSPAGSQWRDRTLTCLQNALVQHLATTSRTCDCKRIKEFAFETHIRCYTQQAASVCRLPLSDLSKIYGIIDAADLLDPDGIRQLLNIARACIAQPN
jgi:hypothetical protein